LLELLDIGKLATEPADWLAGVYVFCRLLHPSVLNLESDPALARDVRSTLVRLGRVLPEMLRDVSRSDDVACALLLLRQCADRVTQVEEDVLSEAALGGGSSGGRSAASSGGSIDAAYDPFLDGPIPPATTTGSGDNVGYDAGSDASAQRRLSWTHPRAAAASGTVNGSVTGSSENAYEGSPLAAAKALIEEFAMRLVHEAVSRLHLRETALAADVRVEGAGEPFAPLTVLGVRFLCQAVRLNPTSALADAEVDENERLGRHDEPHSIEPTTAAGHLPSAAANVTGGLQPPLLTIGGILAGATQPLLHNGATLDVTVAVIARASGRIDSAAVNPFEAATCARALSTLVATGLGSHLLSPVACDAVAEAVDRFSTVVRGARAAGAVHPAHRWLCDSIGMESLHAAVPQEASIFSL
jgi:hypothetical protein